MTTFADITQQVKIQDSLRLTKDTYQNLIETLPFMLLQRDRDFNITYLNPAATQADGTQSAKNSQYCRRDFCQGIIHPDDLPADRRRRRPGGDARGKSTRVEARFRAKDGSLKTVLAFFQPNLHHGEVVGSTSLVVDITTPAPVWRRNYCMQATAARARRPTGERDGARLQQLARR